MGCRGPKQQHHSSTTSPPAPSKKRGTTNTQRSNLPADPSFDHSLPSRPTSQQRSRIMDSFSSGGAAADGCVFSLDVHVHHARDIHNICIYANQDVYAKFSLTCSPDDVISTRVVAGGGKNPLFDQCLRLPVPRPDAVLKCEIWMLSRARSYLDDQLLGFALVPLTQVAAASQRCLSQDFTLSSTDLFHSPAGTVHLTLSLHPSAADDKASNHPNIASSSIASEVVLLDPAEIEFPDIGADREDQQMVSDYFDMGAVRPTTQFLHLGASSSSKPMDQDCEMTTGGSSSPDGSILNSGVFSSSTTTSLSDDRNSADSLEEKRLETSSDTNIIVSPETPNSKRSGVNDGKNVNVSNEVEDAEAGSKEPAGSVFKSPLGNINLEAEQSAMQQQIVDMYMRSMHQFTESLAKMKLPMDLDIPKSEDGGDVIQSQKKKKDGTRVFYGSRAFF